MRSKYWVLYSAGACVALMSCAPTPLDLQTTVDSMKLKQTPLNVGLVLPQELQDDRFIRKVPCAGDYVVRLGSELEKGMVQALSQVFDSVELTEEKQAELGGYDLVVKLQSAELDALGHCSVRRALYALGPLSWFFTPTDTYEGHAELKAIVAGRNGEAIFASLFKSRTYTKDTLSDDTASRDFAVNMVFREALIDTIQQFTRGLVSSMPYRQYAEGVINKKLLGRWPPGKSRPLRSSDVDILPASVAAKQKARYAILVGIEQYRQGLPAAEFASHDAEVMREYLIKTMGYPEENVVLLTDEQATRSDLEKYIEYWLPNRTIKDGTVFFYYSGHGASSMTSQQNYLVPYDADPAYLEATGYALRRVYAQLDKLPAKEILIVLDSCFSGSGRRSIMAKNLKPAIIDLEGPFASEKMAVLAASTGAQVSSTYDKKSHGLLTYFFLKGLQETADASKEGKMDLLQLYQYLRPQVEGVALQEFNIVQTPQLLGNVEMLKQGMTRQ